MKQKKIKSHKGGRTEQLHARLTKEEKARVMAKVKSEGYKSFSDWLMAQLERASRTLKFKLRVQSDLLSEPACCASFLLDGTHHRDCRLAPANRKPLTLTVSPLSYNKSEHRTNRVGHEVCP